MEIEKKLYSEIKNYCAINNLKIGDFINKLLRKAFNIEKYGNKPPFLNEKINNDIIKEKTTDVITPIFEPKIENPQTNVDNGVEKVKIIENNHFHKKIDDNEKKSHKRRKLN